MITALQHSILVDTLTVWAAEFAAGLPTVHQAVYDILAVLVAEFEACSAVVEEAVMVAEESAEEIAAELVSLEPAVGLSGTIVPVATIRNDELYTRHRMPHWGIPGYLGLQKGCKVILRKRMGMPPELSGCSETGRHVDGYVVGDYERPVSCPFCEGDLVYSVDESLACRNADCKSQLGDRLVRFVTVGGMGIPGITEKVVEELLVAGKVDSLDGLYGLKTQDFMEACRVSYTDGYMMMRMVERSKLKPLHMLLDGLGIDGVSREMTPRVAWCIAGSGGLKAMLSEDQSEASGAVAKFGSKCAKMGVGSFAVQSVVSFLAKNRDMMRRFVELGVAQTPVPVIEKKKRTVGKRMRRRKGSGYL